jgi:amino acid adenylation domain-containing protein
MQYADYAAWRHELLSSEETKAGREFWRRLELPSVSKVHLPFERRLVAPEKFDCRSFPSFTVTQVREIEELASRYDCDVSTFLLACYHVLLWRLSGESPVVVGTSFDGRKYDELKNAIGLFATYLPVMPRLGNDSTFSEVLLQLHEAVQTVNLWQEYFDWEQIAGDDTNFFPFTFEYVEADNTNCEAAGISFSRREEYALIDRWKLKLECMRIGDDVQSTFSYDSAALLEDDVSRLSERFQTLLTSVLASPDAPIRELEILPASEQQQLLYDFNERTINEFSSQCLHELVAAQAQRTPNALAVIFENETVTYRELNERANQLAHYLRDVGVSADQLVGICVERSVAMVVGLLGILKAGGAYVPLDPDYPTERIAFLLADAEIPVVLTTEDLRSRLPAHAKLVCIDSDWKEIATRSTEETAAGVTLDNLAYVIYTSGTTGRPKGVMISHRAINNRLLWMQQEFPLGPDDRLLQKTVYTFDASVWELFVPLLSGAKLVMAIPGGHQDSSYLVEAVARHGITVLQLVPSMLQVVLEEPELTRLRSLKRMFCGGELLSLELQRKFFNLVDAELINLYGPTEVSIDATSWVCERESRRSHVTIGRPITNDQVFVLDERLKPAPLGVPGELYVGGVGLARGYWQRPELTAERFVPHPFASRKGERLYRTGDLARYHADGTLEYLGRIDHQVKLRGYRIELGEIEACILEHEAVREAVVTLHNDSNGNQRLVAYVAPHKGNGFEAISPLSLNHHLAERVPRYLIPSTFVMLERMPVLPNGKVDRQSLPAPSEVQPASGDGYIAPRTPLEEVIAAIWSDLLGVTPIGTDANFFEIGGHSLLATQVISRLREAFRVELSLRTLFASPTVAELAAVVEEARKIGAGVALLPSMEPVDRTGELPLSFAQERLWFLQQLEPQSSAYHLFNGIRLRGQLNLSAFEQTLQEIVRRHEILRTTFTVVDGRPFQRIAAASSVSLAVRDLSAFEKVERDAEVERAAQETVSTPFDLVAGPLLRAELLRLSDDEHVLLFVLHHIISDGWSATVLVREVAALYEAFCAKRSSPLPELSIQYADYAAWQKYSLQGEVLENHLSYWRETLKGAPPSLDLPTDKPRPMVQTYNGDSVGFALSKELSEALSALSRREGATIYMTLLGAFQLLMSRYSGQTDIVVGGDTANRTRVETESLIGFFVNQLVLRTNVDGNLTFRELLRRVREVTLGAYAHQQLPFEKLVEELQVVRELNRNPLFQVMFTLQNNTRNFELSGLQLEAVPVKRTSAKFDLTLMIVETTGGLVGGFEYNTDLFNRSTIERLAGHFETLLKSIVAEPEEKVSSLSILTEAERRSLADWSVGQPAHVPAETTPELFEAQVSRTPDAAAVVDEKVSLTYEELNQRANQLAHYLRKQGVDTEVVVGLCLERSVEMVVALLGILKAGGAYLPLDPNYPLQRLEYMLTDAQVGLVLTNQRLLEQLPVHWGQTIVLDEVWEAIASESEANPKAAVEAKNLAYVMYTSGSTGQPKGVMVTHGGLCNLAVAQIECFGVRPDSRVLQFASLNFDASISEICMTLCQGAQLHLVNSEEVLVGPALSALLQEHEISVVTLPPSVLKQLRDGEEFRKLESLIVAGEACGAELVEDWSEGRRFFNAYGPTEATVCGTVQECHRGEGRPGIGKAIANVEVYVLDESLSMVPVGVRGEIYIGGAGVARGYWQRAELTAERFVPHPYSVRGGERLYRTGDEGLYLDNGNIHFIGRRDNQVKLRGYRIELGEIENVLASHHTVREVVVTVREDTPGNRRLVAYVVPHDEESCSTAELHEYAQRRLPEYMTPTAFVLLDALPLNSNGKIDRLKLPAPDGARPHWKGEYVAPRTPLEEVIEGVWGELLSVDRVSVHDNFYDLGGHSLLATQVLARLLTLFKIELPLIAIFQSPTIVEFASEVRAHEAKPGQADKVAAAIRRIQQMPTSEKMALVNERRAAS